MFACIEVADLAIDRLLVTVSMESSRTQYRQVPLYHRLVQRNICIQYSDASLLTDITKINIGIKARISNDIHAKNGGMQLLVHA